MAAYTGSKAQSVKAKGARKMSPAALSLTPDTGHPGEQVSNWSNVHRGLQSREGAGAEGKMGSAPIPFCRAAGLAPGWPQGKKR